MLLQMEVTNQEVLHREEMVREVLMGILQEMRPPPQHNMFKCRNCQWVERRGKVMLKPCENNLASPYQEDYCNTCLLFEDCLALTLKGGLNILILTGSFYVMNLNTYSVNLGEQLLSL